MTSKTRPAPQAQWSHDTSLSPSDQRAWHPAAFILIAIAGRVCALGAGAAIVGLIAEPVIAGMTALATTWTAAATAPRADARLWPMVYVRRRQRRIGV